MPNAATSATSERSRPTPAARMASRVTPAIDRSASATAPSAATALGYQLASNPTSRGHDRLTATVASTSGPSAPREANAARSAPMGTTTPPRNGSSGTRPALPSDDPTRDESTAHDAMPSQRGMAFGVKHVARPARIPATNALRRSG